jgi:outer membrane receptor protein involved in Fe transport
MYAHSEPTYSGGLPGWSTNSLAGNVGGYFWDQNTQRAEYLQRDFSPEEVGGWNGENQHVYTHEFNGSAGLKGSFGDSGFDYDAYYHLSQENTHYVSYGGNYIGQRAAAYYLGPKLGETANGYPIFAPDLARLYTPITPAQYASFVGPRSEYSVSWTDDFTAIVNNSKLFSLPAGNVGVAMVAQYGTDEVHAPAQPNAAQFDNFTERPNSAGGRNHYSLGSEFRVPVMRMLTADVSGRVDHYSYAAGTGFGGSNGSGKFTYKGGLEFRPREDLLVRANYATAFRTPDLFYLFEGPTGSVNKVTDWYQCRLAGYTSKNINDCPLSQLLTTASPLDTAQGSTNLQNVTAKSFTAGVVWSPLENHLRLSIDYSRVDISNKVQQLDTNTALQTEADCRLGSSEAGLTYNINSPTCQNIMAVIQRQSPAGPLDPASITEIHSVPTNIALEHEAGIQSEARYGWTAGRIGSFSVDVRYFRQLQHTTKNFSGDVPQDLLASNVNYNNDEFEYTTSADVVWNIGKFSTTLHGIRYAPTWRYDGSARDLGPWLVVNGSGRYAIAPNMFMQLIVNNIANRRPPFDPSNPNYPYYDSGSYNDNGRAFWLEFGIKFGGSRK